MNDMVYLDKLASITKCDVKKMKQKRKVCVGWWWCVGVVCGVVWVVVCGGGVWCGVGGWCVGGCGCG